MEPIVKLICSLVLLAAVTARLSSAFSATQSELCSKREVGGFSLEDIRYPPGRVIPVHGHAIAGVYVQLTGQVREAWNKREQTFASGTAIFRLADDIHSNVYCAPTRLIAVGIPPGQLARLVHSGIGMSGPVVARSASLELLARRIADNICSDDPAGALILEGATLEIMGELFLRPRVANCSPAVRRAEGVLKETFKKPFSLWALAEEVGVHPAHLGREFRRVHGTTIGEYIRKLRIEYVCDRLRSSSASLSELALEAGFADHSHLCRSFKTLMGISPSEFRATIRSARRPRVADQG